MNTEKITVKFDEVSPATASAWLEHNDGNRRVKETTVNAYARDMLAGKWRLTHQGVAFDDTGRLIDGQHRLLAVVKSGATVPLMVMRGFPSAADADGVRQIDVVDRGVVRSLKDQLAIIHGIKYPNDTVAAVNVLSVICTENGTGQRASIPLILRVVELYKQGLHKFVDESATAMKQFRVGLVRGCFVFAYQTRPEAVDRAWRKLLDGDGLGRNNPVLHLRNWLLADDVAVKRRNSGKGRLEAARVVLNWLADCCEGRDGKPKPDNSDVGRNYFAKAQAARVEQVTDFYRTEWPAEGKPSDYALELLRAKDVSERINKKVERQEKNQ